MCSIIASAVQRLPLFPCLCCQSPCTKALPLLRISQEVCARRSPSAGGKRDFRAQTADCATSWCQAGYERPRCHLWKCTLEMCNVENASCDRLHTSCETRQLTISGVWPPPVNCSLENDNSVCRINGRFSCVRSKRKSMLHKAPADF